MVKSIKESRDEFDERFTEDLKRDAVKLRFRRPCERKTPWLRIH